MTISPNHLTKPEEKEHRFLPRFVGLVSGAIGGLLTGKFILHKKVHQWVEERLFYGRDTTVLNSLRQIKDELKDIDGISDSGKKKHMVALQHKLDAIEKQAQEDRDAKKLQAKMKATAEAEKEFQKNLQSFEAEAKVGGGFTTESLEQAKVTMNARRQHTLQQAYDTQLPKIEGNYKYFYNREKAKALREEVADRMQIGLRQVEGRRWVFIGGGVALGVIGYAGLKIADLILNKGLKNNRHAVPERQKHTENNYLSRS